jgi:hypothetical protein
LDVLLFAETGVRGGAWTAALKIGTGKTGSDIVSAGIKSEPSITAVNVKRRIDGLLTRNTVKKRRAAETSIDERKLHSNMNNSIIVPNLSSLSAL